MKNIKALLMYCLLVIFAGALYSCGDPERVDNLVSQEHKDWGAFKVGTWWVYEEETMKIRDSIFIYRQQIDLKNMDRNSKNHFEETVISYFASNTNIDSGYFVTTSYSSGVQMWYFGRSVGEYIKRCYLVVPPPVQGDAIGTGPTSQFTIFDTIYPKLQIGNFEFTNVVRANNNMNLFYNGTPTLLYSAKHIGIVRKEFPEYKQIWNLVNYHIVQ